MESPHTPRIMTPDQRRCEVAAILARGLLRYQRLAKVANISSTQESGSELQNSLELTAEACLHGATGSAG